MLPFLREQLKDRAMKLRLHRKIVKSKGREKEVKELQISII